MIAAFSQCLESSARAATATWGGAGSTTTTGTWETGTNWSGGSVPNTNAYTANFTGSGNSSVTLTVATNTVNILQFSAGSYTFSGDGLTVDANASTNTHLDLGNSGSGTETFNNSITITDSVADTGALGANNSGTGALVFAGGLNLSGTSGPLILEQTGSGTAGATNIGVTGGITGNSTSALYLLSTGAGIINFSPSSVSNVGAIDVASSSVVNIGTSFSATSLGLGTAPSVGSFSTGTATVYLTGSGNTLTLSSGVSESPISSGTLTFGSNNTSATSSSRVTNTLAGNWAVSNANIHTDVVYAAAFNTFEINGNVTGGGTSPLTTFQITGPGTVYLKGTNSYSGATTFSGGGTVEIGNAAAFGNSTVNLSGGTVEDDGNAYTIADTNNPTLNGTVTFQDLPGSPVSGVGLTYAGLTLNGNSTIVVNNTTQFTNKISGAFGITVQGTGTLLLTKNTNTQVFDTVTSGVLSVSADLDLGPTTGTLTLAGGTFNNDATSFTLNASRSVLLGPASGSASGGTFDVSPSTTLTVGSTIADNTITGDSLTKADTGTLVLAAANTYSGGTIVNGGTVETTIANAITDGGLTINSGTFDLHGTNQSVNGFSGTGGTVANNVSTSTVTLTVGNNNAGGTYAGSILDHTAGTGTLAFAKTGSGAVTLTGSNGYSGGTTVSGGTLYANNAASSLGTGIASVSGGNLGGLGTYAPGGSNYLLLSSSGTLTPGGVQPAVPFTGTAGTTANGSLTISTAAITPGSTIAKINSANLTFALGAGGTTSGSMLVVGGTAANTIAFTGQSTVTINDLVGANLQLNSYYVLIQGNGSTLYTGLGINTSLDNSSMPIAIPTADLALLAPGTAGNFFSQWYTSSQLYIENDDIVVEVVPEPSTWALILGGLGFLVFWQRRRRV